MALSRRSSGRLAANIWPGFVDAMTALLLVLMFVLSIFMIIQFALRETITGQETELDDLSGQIAGLTQALGIERQRNAEIANQLGQTDSQLDDAKAEILLKSALIETMTAEQLDAQAKIASFEEQMASLIAQNSELSSGLEQANQSIAENTTALEAARASIAELEAARDLEINEKEAAQLALAQLREEISSESEGARLASARAEALEALVQDLRQKLEAEREETAALSSAEETRLVEAAAAEALREKLRNSEAELTAMTLALEEQRRKAEETLTLLAAAEAVKNELVGSDASIASAMERQAALLATANSKLAEEKRISAASQREVALLNEQTRVLREELTRLQILIDESAEKDREARVQIESLGSELNAALARAAAEQRARAELEAKERERLEAEATDLRNYRSEFFGRVREILGEREGVQVVGDRFVFSSEVLFRPGSAELGAGGRAQISRVAEVIRAISQEIPPEINWVLRVDGHTDANPIGRGSIFADNWELSQARALSVVKYLINQEGIPADRLAATGFGEFQPIAFGDDPESLAQNRRIELKLTEK